MRKIVLGLVFLTLYTPSVFARLPFFSVQEMFDRSSTIVVGEMLRVEASNGTRVAYLRNLFLIKGEGNDVVVICDDESSQEGFGVGNVVEGKAIYFLKKRDSCFVGAIGYKSIVNFKQNSNCVFSGIVYLDDRNPNGVEDFEGFVSHMLEDKSHGVPEFLRSDGGSCK